MNRRRIQIALAALVVLLAGWYAASPALTMRALRNAAAEGDQERLRDLVDFEWVRENLKTDVRAALAAEATTDDDPFAALGLMIGGFMIDNLVDGFVSPAGISALAQGQTPDAGTGSTKTEGAEFDIDRRGLNRFDVVFEESDGVSRLVFTREGVGWQLIRVALPDSSD